MLAYPTEDNKGKFIAIFWSIFNLGGVVGAAVSFGQNYDSSVSVGRVIVGSSGVEVSFLLLLDRVIQVRSAVVLRPDGVLISSYLRSFDGAVTRGTYVS